MKATIAILGALAVASCGQVSELGECARAVNLQAEAAERARRVGSDERSTVSDADLANEALVAATRYRAEACKADPYLR